MKVVTSTDEYTIYVRRDGRHAVKDANKAPINGDEKIRILLENDLIKAPAPKVPEAEPEAPEAADEGEAEDSGDEAAADAPEDAAEEDKPAE